VGDFIRPHAIRMGALLDAPRSDEILFLSVNFEIVGAILEQETIATARWHDQDGGAPLVRGPRHWAQRVQDQAAPRLGSSQFDVHVTSYAFPTKGYDASLERRKIYIAFVDREADKLGMVRVVDESREDYLYPKDYFAEIKIAPLLAKALARSNR
jgi:hypothetical protein